MNKNANNELEDDPFGDIDILKLSFFTWSNDTNGIFDFSKKIYMEDSKFILGNCYIGRIDNTIYIHKNHSNIRFSDGETLLFFVQLDEPEDYQLINLTPAYQEYNNKNNNDLANKMFYVIKTKDVKDYLNFNKDPYYLSENDIIRFGKVKFEVDKIYIKASDIDKEDSDAPKPHYYDINDKSIKENIDSVFTIHIEENIQDNADNNNQEGIKCYKCKKNDVDKDNPLISLCKCSQKCHFKCLKDELEFDNMNKISNKGGLNIYYKRFECVTCHYEYPIKFKVKGSDKIFYLADIDDNIDKNCSYMILSSIGYMNEQFFCKSVHIIKFDSQSKEIDFGRENYNYIIEKDISISREHACFTYDNKKGKILLENKSKKFGTSVLVQKPIVIKRQPIKLQFGKTVVEARLFRVKEDKYKNLLEEFNKINDE
jgi:hypothetical protein